MKALMEMIAPYGCLSVFANFHEQIPIKHYYFLLLFFYNFNIVIPINNWILHMYANFIG
jgi:hypothetical protein